MVWIKSMGRQILAGNLNLVNTSFPVLMFEPRSYLQKLADAWAYPGGRTRRRVLSTPRGECVQRSRPPRRAQVPRPRRHGGRPVLFRHPVHALTAQACNPQPRHKSPNPTRGADYINAAAAARDPLERMKLLVTWSIAGMHKGLDKWRKPFNPILGETWQAEMEGGISLFMEQVGAAVGQADGRGLQGSAARLRRERGPGRGPRGTAAPVAGARGASSGDTWRAAAARSRRCARPLAQPQAPKNPPPAGPPARVAQVSHHPPVSAYQMLGPGGAWKFYGWSQPAVAPVVKFYGIKTLAKGRRRFELPDGTCIEFFMPHYAIKGAAPARSTQLLGSGAMAASSSCAGVDCRPPAAAEGPTLAAGRSHPPPASPHSHHTPRCGVRRAAACRGAGRAAHSGRSQQPGGSCGLWARQGGPRPAPPPPSGLRQRACTRRSSPLAAVSRCTQLSVCVSVCTPCLRLAGC